MRKNFLYNSNRLLPLFCLFFFFSLFIHNHPVSFINQNSELIHKYDNSKTNHSTEFCSACRLGGNIHKEDKSIVLNNVSFKSDIVTYKIILEDFDLIYYLSPRSPPFILS